LEITLYEPRGALLGGRRLDVIRDLSRRRLGVVG
jgi:hypothetical protein